MNLSNSYIIDTNVLVVANGKYEKANYEHIHICEKFLSEMIQSFNLYIPEIKLWDIKRMSCV